MSCKKLSGFISMLWQWTTATCDNLSWHASTVTCSDICWLIGTPLFSVVAEKFNAVKECFSTEATNGKESLMYNGNTHVGTRCAKAGTWRPRTCHKVKDLHRHQWRLAVTATDHVQYIYNPTHNPFNRVQLLNTRKTVSIKVTAPVTLYYLVTVKIICTEVMHVTCFWRTTDITLKYHLQTSVAHWDIHIISYMITDYHIINCNHCQWHLA